MWPSTVVVPRTVHCRWSEPKQGEVTAWLKQTPSLKVRATLPIVANGNTVAVHVWFDG